MENNADLRKVPIVAVRGTVIFPHTDPVLTFSRKSSIAALQKAFQEDKVIAVFAQKDSRTVEPELEDLYEVGTISTISQMMTTQGEVHAVIRGQARVRLEELVENEAFMIGTVRELKDERSDVKEVAVISKNLTELFKKSINLGKQAEIMTVMKLVSGNVDAVELVDQIAFLLELKIEDKQKLLETFSLKDRLQKVHEYLSHEVSILELERSLSVKTQKRFEDQMRKAMLKEKKRTIEEELGEESSDLSSEEISVYRSKIKKANMPKVVRIKAKKELDRLQKLSPMNPETGYIRNYLDWLTDMPWDVKSPNNMSLKKASKVLSDEHYGLDKAKERILEYLAVMKLKESAQDSSKSKKTDLSQPTILCFVGPPGVGKTSIGKSIAHALGRKFVRVSLGGVRDEAEIRGHRRTYVGALPGRIIQGIKNSGTRNPVFMLDEVDKLGMDFRGDPSSALLEALDPEQNKEFSDHYLEVPFDLSEVMFIATGNVLENIPLPLQDRLEVINFPGYTLEEKFNIAKDFLIPKQFELHGLEDRGISIDDEAIKMIIERYTREAGVRGLERSIATICRKLARKETEGKKYEKTVNLKMVSKYLGPARFTSLIAEKKDEVGMATGLAVTASGGEILFIEVALMPGKGKLMLTGQLGDVMKESAKAAFTWVKSHWHELGLKENFSKNIDVHIHVPEGAVPKDGPSAGIALSSALVSALTGVSVRRDVGMTGEITLRGSVLPIGGVKDKVIAGHRAGLKTIILPMENKKDMEDVPKNVKKDIKFVFAEKLDDVLPVSLSRWPLAKSTVEFRPLYSMMTS